MAAFSLLGGNQIELAWLDFLEYLQQLGDEWLEPEKINSLGQKHDNGELEPTDVLLK